MRNGEGVHFDLADFKGRAGFKQPNLETRLQDGLDGFAREAVAINGQAQLHGDRNETLNVVAVLVRDENARERFGRTIDRGEALADLAATEPGVDEEARLSGFEIRAIAGGTAAENREGNCHAPTLEVWRKCGNDFLGE